MSAEDLSRQRHGDLHDRMRECVLPLFRLMHAEGIDRVQINRIGTEVTLLAWKNGEAVLNPPKQKGEPS